MWYTHGADSSLRSWQSLSWPINPSLYLLNLQVHYRVHKSPPLAPIQLNPVHALETYFLNIDFNIILPYLPSSIIDWTFKRIFHFSHTCNTQHVSSISPSLTWSPQYLVMRRNYEAPYRLVFSILLPRPPPVSKCATQPFINSIFQLLNLRQPSSSVCMDLFGEILQ
jgi:hypothetical protein